MTTESNTDSRVWNPLTWIFIGFSVVYLVFFIYPVFLNSAGVMRFFTYVPPGDSIGGDLRQMLSYSRNWYVHNGTPYVGDNLYPPMAAALFAPLLSVQFLTAFKIVTGLSILSYAFLAFFLPLHLGASRSLVILFSISGFYSYGFQFELERGQFNLIAVSLALIAVLVNRSAPRLSYLGYLLFCLSVQLKIYPAVFLVMFITDWRDVRRVAVIGSSLILANIALLFCCGSSVFFDFAEALRGRVANPYPWIGNHSIASFSDNVAKYIADGKLSSGSMAVQSLEWTQTALFCAVCASFLIVLFSAYRFSGVGVNSALLLASTIIACLIPPVSHDYKLPILTGPTLILLSRIHPAKSLSRVWRFMLGLSVAVFSIAYFSTLFSHTNKPLLLSNNCPALALMLTLTAIFSVLSTTDDISPCSAGQAKRQDFPASCWR